MKEEIKRNGLLTEIQTIMDSAVNDKNEIREFTPEENTKLDSLKKEVDSLNKRINLSKELIDLQKTQAPTAEVRNETASTFDITKAIRNFTQNSDISTSDWAYMAAEAKREGVNLKRGQFYIPAALVAQRAAQRAANTTTTNSNQVRVNQGPDLSFVPYPILYNKIGARIYEGLEGGKLDLVSMANYTVTFGTENSSGKDVSVSGITKATLTPQPVNATAAFSRELISQSNPAIMQQILDTFMIVIDGAIDKKAFSALSGLTNAITTGVTYADILKLESATNATPTAFISSFKGRSYLKSKEKSATSTGNFVWGGVASDNEVAGYTAYASPQVPNALYVLGNFQDLAVGKWGGLVIIEDIFSSKRSNLVEYSVIQMADVQVVNSASFAVCKNGMFN